jgi:hypothetical protein
MKKIFLLGCLILITACQTTTVAPTPEPSLFPTETLPPTPIPDTQTPEPTPTFEFTPTPLPRFFTNQFDSSLAGWVILQAGNDSVPNIFTENSALRLQMDSPYTWHYALYGAEDYADIHVETQFTNSALTPASAGLVCRYSEENGWLEYNVSTDGTYNVLYGKWLAVGIADYLPIIDGSSREIGQSGEMQYIGLTCKGTTLQLYVNGNIIRSVDVTRYELTEGKVGLTASSFENMPVIVTFDSVTVSDSSSP